MDVLKKLKLPSEATKEGGRVWIESLDVRLRDDLLPTTFRGGELQDIYAEIEKQIDTTRFPLNNWCFVGAKLAVRLPGVFHEGNAPVFSKFASGEKAYTICIGEGSFSIPGKNKSFIRKHLDILESLQNEWKFKGLTREQKTLGKKQVTVQGELIP